MIVIVPPRAQDGASLSKRGEQRLVEQFVAQAGIEALDEGILLRLAGRDVMPLDPRLLRPAQDRQAGEFGAIVGNTHRRPAAPGNDGLKFAHYPQTRQ